MFAHAILPVALFSGVMTAVHPDWTRMRVVYSFKQETAGALLHFSFSADGRRFLTVGGNTLRLRETETGKEIASYKHRKAELPGNSGWPYAASLLPDGRMVAVSFYEAHDLVFLDMFTGKIVHRLSDPQLGNWLALSPDAKLYLSYAPKAGYGDRALLLWDTASGKMLRRLRLRDPASGHELDPKRKLAPFDYQDECEHATFSSGGKIVAVAVRDQSVRLCDVESGAEIRRLFDNDGSCRCMAFSPDGKFLATASGKEGMMARLWDVATGKLVREFRFPPLRLPHGVELDEVDILRPYRIEYYDHERRRKVVEGPGTTWALAFSTDGRTLGTSYMHGTALWEIASGQIRCQIPHARAQPVAFSRCGLLVAGTIGGGILWNWRKPLSKPSTLSHEEADALWSQLAKDARAGCKAIVSLTARPKECVESLAERLRPVERLTPMEIDALIGDLDHKTYAVREQALQRLTRLGEASRSAVERARAGKTPPEMRKRLELLIARLDGPLGPEQLRFLRAVETLEWIGTPDARNVLMRLADGAHSAIETEHARAALSRLKHRE